MTNLLLHLGDPTMSWYPLQFTKISPYHTIPYQYVVCLYLYRKNLHLKSQVLVKLLRLLFLLFCFKINIFSVEIILLSLYPTHTNFGRAEGPFTKKMIKNLDNSSFCKENYTDDSTN